MSDIVERLRQRDQSYREGGPSSEHEARMSDATERLISVLRDAFKKEQIVRRFHVLYAEEVAAENATLAAEVERIRKERDLMAREWCDFCETMGVAIDTQEAVAAVLTARTDKAEAEVGRLRTEIANLRDASIRSGNALYAARAEASAAVKVKALEWETGVVDWAKPFPGMKYVACSTTPAGSWAWWLEEAPETRDVHSSEYAAKAAAQADYERRIRSALDQVFRSTPKNLSALTTEPTAPQEPTLLQHTEMMWTGEGPYGVAAAPQEAEAVAYAFVVDGECEDIGWGEPPLKDDPALVMLYAHPPAQAVTEAHRFPLGARVTKTKGSSWTGRVVGFYSTALNPVGYCVESETETGSVQIYPESALTAAQEAGQ